MSSRKGRGAMDLVLYESAKSAMSEFRSINESIKYIDTAADIAAIAKVAGDKSLEMDAAEVRLRHERLLGKAMEEMPNLKRGRKPSIGVPDTPIEPLTKLGIDKNLAKAARSARTLDDKTFERVLGIYRKDGQTVSAKKLQKAQKAQNTHVGKNSGENEWYTPTEFVEAARAAMGGIDLDPATSKRAQKTVRAKRFYTKSDNGLSKKWAGRVWMNPPYSKELLPSFIERYLSFVESGDIEQGTVLVNNATETKWFQELADNAAAVCFPKQRIRFLTPSNEKGHPLQGQAILYSGKRTKTFCKVFSGFGFIGVMGEH